MSAVWAACVASLERAATLGVAHIDAATADELRSSGYGPGLQVALEAVMRQAMIRAVLPPFWSAVNAAAPQSTADLLSHDESVRHAVALRLQDLETASYQVVRIVALWAVQLERCGLPAGVGLSRARQAAEAAALVTSSASSLRQLARIFLALALPHQEAARKAVASGGAEAVMLPHPSKLASRVFSLLSPSLREPRPADLCFGIHDADTDTDDDADDDDDDAGSVPEGETGRPSDPLRQCTWLLSALAVTNGLDSSTGAGRDALIRAAERLGQAAAEAATGDTEPRVVVGLPRALVGSTALLRTWLAALSARITAMVNADEDDEHTREAWPERRDSSEFVEQVIKRLFSESLLPALKVLSEDVVRVGADACVERAHVLRSRQMFSIVREFPESVDCLVDLRTTLRATNDATVLVASTARALQSRLLHPGVSTPVVIRLLLATIRCLRFADPSGIALEAASQPVQAYIRERRPDAVAHIVSMLVDTPASRRARRRLQAPASDKEDSARLLESAMTAVSSTTSSRSNEPDEDEAAAESYEEEEEEDDENDLRRELESRRFGLIIGAEAPAGSGGTAGQDSDSEDEGDEVGEATATTGTVLAGPLWRPPFPDTEAWQKPLVAINTGEGHTDLDAELAGVDLFGSLVAVLGSAEPLCRVYESRLASRLIECSSFDIDDAVESHELLKTRLGESALHRATVMLKDLSDSRRVGTLVAAEAAPTSRAGMRSLEAELLGRGAAASSSSSSSSGGGGGDERRSMPFPAAMVLSRLFWPGLSAYGGDQPTATPPTIQLHPSLAESMAEFARGYAVAKTPRKLAWLAHLGGADVSVRLGRSRRVIEARGSLVQVSALLYVADQLATDPDGAVSTALVADRLKVDETEASRALRHWVTSGVLARFHADERCFVAADRDPEPSRSATGNRAEDDAEEALDPLEAQARAQREAVVRQFVMGMLRNFPALPQDRIRQMLTMFGSYDGSDEELTATLAKLVSEGALRSSGGVYSLPAA